MPTFDVELGSGRRSARRRDAASIRLLKTAEA